MDSFPTVHSILDQKSASFNWTDGASFILTQNRDKQESLNSGLRDYYNK